MRGNSLGLRQSVLSHALVGSLGLGVGRTMTRTLVNGAVIDRKTSDETIARV